MPTEPLTVAFLALSLFVAGFAKGVSGTGLPLIAVPLMTLMIDLQLAVALITPALLGTNIVQAATSRELPYALRGYWGVMVAIPVGTAVGTWLLAHADALRLEQATGVIVLASLAFTAFGKRFEISPAALVWARPVAGVIAGVIGGMTAIFAPPLLILLLLAQEEKECFVAILALCYIVASASLALFLSGLDLLGGDTAFWGLVAFGPVLAGQIAGTMARGLLSEIVFRRAIQAVLLATAVKMILP